MNQIRDDFRNVTLTERVEIEFHEFEEESLSYVADDIKNEEVPDMTDGDSTVMTEFSKSSEKLESFHISTNMTPSAVKNMELAIADVIARAKDAEFLHTLDMN